MERFIIIFGAFDRHNFGDLLFPHIAAALLRDEDLAFTAGSQGHFLHCINPEFQTLVESHAPAQSQHSRG